MPSWPATLPQYMQVQGYSEALPDQAIESATDAGPPKVRRRFTKNYRPITGTIWCTLEQIEDFEDFYDDDLAGGVLSFTWKNPITQQSKTFRFRGGAPPQLNPVGSTEPIAVRLTLWQLD